MSEYRVYLDDSGHPNDQPYVIVAGFLSTEERWLTFEQAWEPLLIRHNLGTVFHMVDFEASKRTRREKGRILEDLTTVINNHVQTALSAAVDMHGYRRVNEFYALEEGIGTPYAVAARAVARGINSWKQRFFDQCDRLSVFIEEGTKHRGDMEEAFRRDKLPVPRTVPKRHARVQPADMLAWEVFHFIRYNDYRRSLVNLLKEKLPCIELEGIFRERNLIKTCKAANIPLRASMSPNTQFVYHSSPKRIRRRTIS